MSLLVGTGWASAFGPDIDIDDIKAEIEQRAEVTNSGTATATSGDATLDNLTIDLSGLIGDITQDAASLGGNVIIDASGNNANTGAIAGSSTGANTQSANGGTADGGNAKNDQDQDADAKSKAKGGGFIAGDTTADGDAINKAKAKSSGGDAYADGGLNVNKNTASSLNQGAQGGNIIAVVEGNGNSMAKNELDIDVDLDVDAEAKTGDAEATGSKSFNGIHQDADLDIEVGNRTMPNLPF